MRRVDVVAVDIDTGLRIKADNVVRVTRQEFDIRLLGIIGVGKECSTGSGGTRHARSHAQRQVEDRVLVEVNTRRLVTVGDLPRAEQAQGSSHSDISLIGVKISLEDNVLACEMDDWRHIPLTHRCLVHLIVNGKQILTLPCVQQATPPLPV